MPTPEEVDLAVAEAFAEDQQPLVQQVESGAVLPEVAEVFAEEERDAAQDGYLRLLFEGGLKNAPDRHAGIIRLAEQSGVSPRLVADNYDALEAQAKAAAFDPAEFRRRAPELARLLLERPELAPVAMQDPALQEMQAGLRPGAMIVAPEQKGYLQRGVEALGDYLQNPETWRSATDVYYAEEQNAKGRDLNPKLRPLKNVPMQVSDTANAEGVDRLAIYADAFRRERQGLERSRLGTSIMRREAMGLDAFDLEAQRVEMEQAQGPEKWVAPSELEKIGLDAAKITASQVETVAAQGLAGATGKAVGAGIGALTKNPALGAKVGGALAKWGSRVFGLANSFDLEAGGAYLEFRNIKGPNGEQLDKRAAIGAAALYGALAAAVEVGATEATLQAFGIGGKAITGVGKKEIADALVKDATFRRMAVAAGKDWAASIKGEAGEEAVQDGLQKAIGYLLKRSVGDQTPADIPGALGEVTNAAATGALGAAATGPLSLTFNIASQEIARSRMVDAERQISAIQAAASKSKLAQASPEALAKLVEDTTGADGAPVSALYIDPDSLTRLFQETSDPDAAAREVMGEEGPARLQRAAQTGQLLEVPMAEWVSRWASKPLADALVQQRDVTTRSYWQTPNQLAKASQDAQAEQAATLERMRRETAPESEAEAAWLARLEAQTLEAGASKKVTAEQAADQIAVARAAVRTLSSRSGMSVDRFLELYGDWVIRAAPEADLSGFAPAAALVGQRWSGLDEDGKVREHYQDPNTGAWNNLAWEEGLGQEEAAAKPLVARLAIEGGKQLNDTRGHEALDGAYRAAVNGLASRPGGGHVFKVGGDLVIRVADRAELDAAIASVRAGKWWDGRYQITGHLGATLEEADQAGKAERDEARRTDPVVDKATGQVLKPAKKRTLAERADPPIAMAGLQGADLEVATALANVHFRRAQGAPRDVAIPKVLREALAKKGDTAAAASTYVHPRTGLLTDRGWRSIPRKKHVASIDLRGLKALNEAFGGPGADSVMDIFGRILAKHGVTMDAAHLHGDEYAMQSDDAKALKHAIAGIRAVCDNVRDYQEAADGESVTVLQGIQFAAKIGESYDEADAAINRAKARTKLGEPDPDVPEAVAPVVIKGRDAAAAALADLRRRGDSGLQPTGPTAFGPGSQDVAGVLSRLHQVSDEGRGPDSSGDPRGSATGPGRLMQGGQSAFSQPATSLDSISQKAKEDGLKLNLFDHGETIHLDRIVIPEGARGSGKGSKVMKSITDYADVTGKTLTLTPSTDFGATSKARLVEFYKRFGFIENKGKNKNLEISEEMYRVPANNPSILESRGPDNRRRGFVDQVAKGEKRAFSIFLTKDQDLSTLLHEQGHVFLTILDALSQRPDATQQIRDDLATALRWLGAKDVASLTREQHEAWARGFERYLRDGKAPSLELSSAFEAFKRWLRRIYERVADLRVNVSPEVRGVFDRILATDDQIEISRREAGLQPMFRSPEEAGMSAAEWTAYLADQQTATAHAQKAARLADLKDKLAEMDGGLRGVEEEARKRMGYEYDRLPESRAVALLARGQLVDEDGGVLASKYGRFDRGQVVAILGEQVTAEMEERHGIKWRAAKAKGPGPSLAEAADLLGFASVEAMVRGVEGHATRDAWVEVQAQAMLDAEMGSDLAERDRLREEVEKGLHGDSTASWLAAELKALRQRTAPGTKPPRLDAIRKAAEEVLSGMELRQLASAPGRALQAERSAGEKALKAATKGNFEQAYVHKQQQLLNHYLWRAARDAQRDLERLQTAAKTLGKVSTRERLGQASQVYLDASDTILEAIGLHEQRPREEQPASIAQAAQQLSEDGISVLFDVDAVGRIVAQGKPWRMLTVPEGREVLGALTQIRKASGDRLTAIVDGQRMERDEVIAHLSDEAAANLPRRPPAPSSTAAATLLQSAASMAHKLDGDLTRPGTLIDWLGGDSVTSWWHRAVMKPLQQAKHREYDLMQSAVKPVVEAFEKLPGEVRRRLNESVDGATLFPDHRQDIQAPTKRFELLMLALNLGNDSNRQRVLDGRGISEEQANRALSSLTEVELEWVQAVWDACESLWPLTRDLERRVSGLAPPKIDATPLSVTVKDEEGQDKQVTLRGGYFPAVYDRTAASNVGERQALDSIAGMLPNFTRPGTPHSHTKTRAESFADVIVLDPSVISAHLSQVVHDLAFREPLRSVGRLLMDQRTQAILKERLGHERSALFLKWLQDTGSARGSDVASHESARGMGSLIRKLRSNAAVATLGYALDIALGDLTNILVPVVSTRLRAKHWAAGLAEFTGSPLAIRREALAKSGELRFRRDGLVKEMRQHFDRMTAKTRFSRGLAGWWKDNAFVFMEATDAATVTPIWWGSYRQGLAEHAGDEAKAVEFADKVVRDTFPSHSSVDQSAILRDKGLAGSLLLFYGYFNVLLNRYRMTWHPVYIASHSEQGGTGKAVARASAQTLAISMVTAVMADFLVGRGPEPEDGDDDRERWATWMQRRLILGPLAAVPFASPLVDVASGKKPSAREAPGAAIGYEVAKAASKVLDADDQDKAIKAGAALLKVLALATGKPGTRPIRTGEYLARSDGASDADSVLELLSGLIFGDRGEKQGATPLNPSPD